MLWELWRRLDPSSFVVLTTPHPDAAAWDADQPFRVVRSRQKVLWPTPGLRHEGKRVIVAENRNLSSPGAGELLGSPQIRLPALPHENLPGVPA